MISGVKQWNANGSSVMKVNGTISTINPNKKILMPLIRKVAPDIIAADLVGVQPMTGPIGEILTGPDPEKGMSEEEKVWYRLKNGTPTSGSTYITILKSRSNNDKRT